MKKGKVGENAKPGNKPKAGGIYWRSLQMLMVRILFWWALKKKNTKELMASG